ncbi:MAG: hypothetical protein HRT69_16570, partial [Flavobacteriaceae bacterium]|nr:hypothetical protein [Flavobacteriaceae bacterium]
MKRLITSLSLLIVSVSFAQSIDVNPTGAPESSMSLEQLIEDVFLGASCATVSNITTQSYSNVNYTDASFNTQTGEKSYAYFTHSGGNFPVTKGVILSNGAATFSEGANTLAPMSGVVNSGDTWDGDTDMQTILDNRFGDTQVTSNATIVEFDFTPISSTFSFKYIFASEEYQERNDAGSDYECSSFQDGFAFILTGTGVTNDTGITGKNIALLADGVTPVSAGTIHNNAEACAPAQNVSLHVDYATDSTAGTAPIQYNGRTVLLTASHAVIPGEVYHMKMVIADRSDDVFDSAVFLQASDAVAIAVDLGSDINICGSVSETLTASGVFSGSETYIWTFNGVTIAGATSGTYNATQAGTYVVAVTDGSQCASDTVIITAASPSIDAITNQTVCDSYTLPAITGTLLTGNAQYFTSVNGGGTAYSVGSVVNFTDFPSYPVTLYAYDETGTVPNCTNEKSFELTIKQSPVINAIANIVACDSYALPAITGVGVTATAQYYTATNGGGTAYAVGTTINF